jgi:hypothetical protein
MGNDEPTHQGIGFGKSSMSRARYMESTRMYEKKPCQLEPDERDSVQVYMLPAMEPCQVEFSHKNTPGQQIYSLAARTPIPSWGCKRALII